MPGAKRSRTAKSQHAAWTQRMSVIRSRSDVDEVGDDFGEENGEENDTCLGMIVKVWSAEIN
jgi:hypothetical protein